ncbi:MAG: P63C domain-containing protein, partial [Nitrososphaera sp.]|nr:P63C domain-containing protein [Nitrososphaera sp.]
IIALVDEATGFQAIRDREALQEILDRFLRKELAAWAKRFPNEFYQEIFRLRGWQWKGIKVNRPQVVATYTKDLVYERLAPGILEELEVRNPKTERGYRKHKHHQWLTEDVGHPALAQHLYALLGFMRVSSSWKEFYSMVRKAFPKKGETLFLPVAEPPQ